MPDKRRVHLTPYWRLFARRWLPTIVCTLAIVTMVFGLGGFAWQYAALASIPSEAQSPPTQDWSIPFFKTVQLFLLNSGAEDDVDHPSNWLLMIARVSAAMLFLAVSSAVILRVLDDVRRLPRLLTRRNHTVICGLGQIGLQLLDDLDMLGRATDVIIVENNPANPWLDYARNMGATVIIGDSTKRDTLEDARVAKAAEIFIVNGDDGVNLEATAELGMLLASENRHGKPLQLYVHIVDTNFATTLRPYCKVLHDSPNMSVQVFNVPRTAALRLVTQQLWPHAPKQPEEVAHFVILGFGAMGQAMALQLAQLGHFPNRKRSRFTIADRDVAISGRTFLSRFPRFCGWTDGETAQLGVDTFCPEADAWQWNEHPLPGELRLDSPHAIQYACNAEFLELPAGRSDERFAMRLASQFSETGVKPVIFVCGRQDRDNFEMAVQLHDQLSCHDQSNVPIFVWLPRQPALAETLSRTKDGVFVPFGECRSAASYEEITAPIRENIGIKIHDDYERQAIKAGYRKKKVPWSNLRDDFRESNRLAADHLLIKLATLGLRLRRSGESPARSVEFGSILKPQARLLAEMEHNRWVAERLLAGWRHAPEGQSKEETEANKQRKLNHNLIAWEHLGADRKKDFDQVKTVLRECQQAGFSVEKMPDTEHGRSGDATDRPAESNDRAARAADSFDPAQPSIAVAYIVDTQGRLLLAWNSHGRAFALPMTTVRTEMPAETPEQAAQRAAAEALGIPTRCAVGKAEQFVRGLHTSESDAESNDNQFHVVSIEPHPDFAAAIAESSTDKPIIWAAIDKLQRSEYQPVSPAVQAILRSRAERGWI